MRQKNNAVQAKMEEKPKGHIELIKYLYFRLRTISTL